MKYLVQAAIILLLSFLGEALHTLIPLPVPASIYGLLLMLLCLCTGVLKLHQIAETASFLLKIMPVLFLPAIVGLLAVRAQLLDILIPLLVILAATTYIVMAVTGKTTEAALRLERRKRDA